MEIDNNFDNLGNPLVTTDKADYAPREIVRIKTVGFEAGSTIEFAIADDPNRPGDDGEVDTYQRFSVTDGGAGDLDGIVNGQILTNWLVPTDNNGTGSGTPDALNATLNLTATGTDGRVAMTTFTDSLVPSNSIDSFNAWDPTLTQWRPDGAQSYYREGDVIPFRIETKNLQEGQTYTIAFGLDLNRNVNGALSFIDTDLYNKTVTPSLGINGILSAATGDGFQATSVSSISSKYVGFYTSNTGVTLSDGSAATLDPGYLWYEVKFTPDDGDAIANESIDNDVVVGGIIGSPGASIEPSAVGQTAYKFYSTIPTTVPNGKGATANGNSVFQAVLGGSNKTVNFKGSDILTPTFSISGTKYLDANGDGLTAGDSGLGGVTVYIDSDSVAGFSASDLSTTTAADGTWSFANLGSSSIGKSVFEVLPSGYTQTLGQAGYALTSTNQAGLNFANFKLFDISGTKYLDANGDGLTAGDSGLKDFTIFVDKNGNGLNDDGSAVTTVTDDNGNWSIAGLGIDALGKKIYEVNQDGYSQTLGVGG